MYMKYEGCEKNMSTVFICHYGTLYFSKLRIYFISKYSEKFTS